MIYLTYPLQIYTVCHLKLASQNYNLYSLEDLGGRLSGTNVFTIQIEENPYNVNGAFNYVPGAIEDFSQITG